MAGGHRGVRRRCLALLGPFVAHVEAPRLILGAVPSDAATRILPHPDSHATGSIALNTPPTLPEPILRVAKDTIRVLLQLGDLSPLFPVVGLAAHAATAAWSLAHRYVLAEPTQSRRPKLSCGSISPRSSVTSRFLLPPCRVSCPAGPVSSTITSRVLQQAVTGAGRRTRASAVARGPGRADPRHPPPRLDEQTARPKPASSSVTWASSHGGRVVVGRAPKLSWRRSTRPRASRRRRADARVGMAR